MNDTAELIGIIVLVMIAGLALIIAISVPVAFLGWLLLVFINLFTTVTITYINCVVVGIVVPMIISWISK